MSQLAKNESGQISILVLAISLVLLFGSLLTGALTQVLVEQQRLNTKAESIALAGAQELQFNQARACDVAKEFSVVIYGLTAECTLQTHGIFIELSKPISSAYFGPIITNIYASSRAGIATDD
jgi:hypothetical protein